MLESTGRKLKQSQKIQQPEQKPTLWWRMNLRSVASALKSPAAYIGKQLGIIPTETNDNKIRTISNQRTI